MEIQAILQAFQSPLSQADRQQLTEQLEHHIRYLIHYDFDRLVQLLYTIDIEEQKLKALLQQQPVQDASTVISSLIIERQLQKELSRRQFQPDAMDDAERW